MNLDSRGWRFLVENKLVGILVGLLVLLFALFLAVGFSESAEKCIAQLLGVSAKYEALKFLGIGMGGLLVAIQAAMSYRRAKAMEEAAKAQAGATAEQAKANQNTEQGQRQERLKNAIEHLGHESDSVRLGGAYELFHLAEDTEALRQTVLDILCAHIRRTTGENKYRDEHESKPSEEIQSLLTLLFVQDHDIFKDLHINLQESWLKGADLHKARLEEAKLDKAHLEGAGLREANLQGTKLSMAHLQGAQLSRADLREADLQEAHLQRANLRGAHLQGAQLSRANLREVDLQEAHLQEAYLWRTHLEEAQLSQADLQGAKLLMAHLQGADLSEANLQGAKLLMAHLQGAYLTEVNLQGCSGGWPYRTPFGERIRMRIGEESDLSGVVFGGGLSRSDVDSIVEGFSDLKATLLRRRLEPRIDEKPSHELPEDSDAEIGAYTKEEAEQWIAQYEKAMSGIPKAGNS